MLGVSEDEITDWPIQNNVYKLSEVSDIQSNKIILVTVY